MKKLLFTVGAAVLLSGCVSFDHPYDNAWYERPHPNEWTGYSLRDNPRPDYGSKAYWDLRSRPTPSYNQSRPRQTDPFYNTVNRTGSNPMNTNDRTTNRTVYP